MFVEYAWIQLEKIYIAAKNVSDYCANSVRKEYINAPSVASKKPLKETSLLNVFLRRWKMVLPKIVIIKLERYLQLKAQYHK